MTSFWNNHQSQKIEKPNFHTFKYLRLTATYMMVAVLRNWVVRLDKHDWNLKI